MTARKDVPSGTLDMLVLRVISRSPIHGWGLMKRLGELTDNVFQVTPGGLFPALQRLEEDGWIAGEWGVASSFTVPLSVAEALPEVAAWRVGAAFEDAALPATVASSPPPQAESPRTAHATTSLSRNEIGLK